MASMLIRDEQLAGSKVTVMGLGRFGGGIGVTRWLVGKGADVLVTDMASAESLAPSVLQIQDLVDSGKVKLRLGEHNVSDFTTCDVVVANPAVPKPWENRYLRAAEAAGIPITTEIRLVVERLPDRKRVIGVTGTAGKSTTSAMIAHVLGVYDRCTRTARNEKVYLGGNLGGSLLDCIEDLTKDDLVVLELSSAQLYWLDAFTGSRRADGWSPGVAVVTNIAQNHLDWHGTFELYRDAKRVLLDHQDRDDFAVFGSEVAKTTFESHVRGVAIDAERNFKAGMEAFRAPFSKLGFGEYDAWSDASLLGLALPGNHNRVNMATALAAAEVAPRSGTIFHDAGGRLLGNDQVFLGFPGLPHRLQHAGDFGGVKVFNDSKCTTPEAARLAIEAFDDVGWPGARNIHLIAGGYDKKIDLAPMVAPAARCARVYTIGATGESLAGAIRAAGGRAVYCGTLERAVAEAAKTIKPRQVLLLSPGCASWDQFTNYEERGARFIELAKRHLASPERR